MERGAGLLPYIYIYIYIYGARKSASRGKLRQEEKCVNSEFWKSASTLYIEIARKVASRGKVRPVNKGANSEIF